MKPIFPIIAILFLYPLQSNAQTSPAKVVEMILINSETNERIAVLSQGDIVNIAALPTRSLNIQAITKPDKVSSVVFQVNQTKRFRHETAPPYAMAGDRNGNFLSWVPKTKPYRITAIPYLGKKRGTPLTLAIEVTHDPMAPQGIIQTLEMSSPEKAEKEEVFLSKKTEEIRTSLKQISQDPQTPLPITRKSFELTNTTTKNKSGSCTIILNSSQTEMTLLCNHALKNPTQAILSNLKDNKIHCKLDSPENPLIGVCPLTETLKGITNHQQLLLIVSQNQPPETLSGIIPDLSLTEEN